MNTCPNGAPADGGVTVMAAVPLCPSLVAVIVAEPATTPLTSPLGLTVATEVLLLDHVIVRPVSAFPLASFGVAVSWSVLPAGTLPEAGLTVTEATGTCTTVMAAVPLCPSLMAVIVAEPATLPVTSPLELTVATVVLLLDHAIVRPDSGLPPASFGVAVSCTVLPSFTLADVGVTLTDATGTLVTVMLEVPLCPSLVAVIVADPAPPPVTRPLLETDATEPLLLDHVTVRPVSGLPLASFGVAVSWTVWPTGTLADAGLTVTELTATFDTVMLALPLCPSLIAVIVAEPTAAPLTSPVLVTVATELLLLDQATVRPVSGFPFASFGVAVSWTVWPTGTLADAGLTVTELTGTGTLDTVMLDVPLFPSLVAVIVAEPAVPPVTSPLPSTLATDVLLLDQVTARPASGFPFASFGVAVSCTVAPVATVAAPGVTVTETTGSALVR